MYCVWIQDLRYPGCCSCNGVYQAGEALGVDEDFETKEEAEKWCAMYNRDHKDSFAYPVEC